MKNKKIVEAQEKKKKQQNKTEHQNSSVFKGKKN